MKKRYCPGYWDLFFGGVVQKVQLILKNKDETYEENAARELVEETGLTGLKPTSLFDFYFESERTKSWGRVDTSVYKGILRNI